MAVNSAVRGRRDHNLKAPALEPFERSLLESFEVPFTAAKIMSVSAPRNGSLGPEWPWRLPCTEASLSADFKILQLPLH